MVTLLILVATDIQPRKYYRSPVLKYEAVCLLTDQYRLLLEAIRFQYPIQYHWFGNGYSNKIRLNPSIFNCYLKSIFITQYQYTPIEGKNISLTMM